ncbi:DNA-directed DNA polymerase [Handroanthus impetiginosus]|uniref:DNA-directed DNA polymerase n=1 Tax=Handroanthus impetiginosus TaxID=429701 RepID=A0A2G9H3Y9_9LAMI|nr:DNA-directed DNA polymerase [Handroanthus impetiginosus]
MAKMGFSAQTNLFRPYSFCPPKFWFCRSCIQFYSFSSFRKGFCRSENGELKSANGLFSNGALRIDLLELKCRLSYSTFQHDENEMPYPTRTNAPYPPREKPSVQREVGRRAEYDKDVWNGIFQSAHTAEYWGKATEQCGKNKKLFAHSNRISANLKILPEEDIAEKSYSGGRNTKDCFVSQYEGERNVLSRKEEVHTGNVAQQGLRVPLNQTAPVQVGYNRVSYTNGGDNTIVLDSNSMMKVAGLDGYQDSLMDMDSVFDKKETHTADKISVSNEIVDETRIEKIPDEASELRQTLSEVYDWVLVVDSIPVARQVVGKLTNQYKHLIHACDTEVAKIDVKEETPVDHGEIICFSIYSGPEADFGGGKSCVWIDVLDGGGKDILTEFAPFFEDPSVKKVWHNYSFDNHIIENYGLKVSGFFADTMHMARLWNTSRRTEGGYSLEALTGDSRIMSDAKTGPGEKVIGKVSMKNIFGMRKMKKDGSEGKLITIPPVEELQRVDRKLWICYSSLDSISTLRLYESLERKLLNASWRLDGHHKGSMFDFYEKYLRPFGEILVKMETEGMLVDRLYLAEIEKVAKVEQQVAAERFRKWASKYCPDAKYMNVGSDAQLRQFLFGGIQNRKDPNEFLPVEKEFKVPNTDNIIEQGKKTPMKYRKIRLQRPDGVNIETDKYTASGWPSVSRDALKNLAGNVSADFDFLDEDVGAPLCKEPDTSAYGAAYYAIGGGRAGIEACHAIAALCEVCSIDSLISNFILPLQGSHISGNNGRIHCSLNINTETGRLSARRPNLQNQPALEKDRYKIRQAFIAAPGNSLIVADYGQLELRILAHLANCESMLDAFKAGGDFHSRTAMNMYPHIREAIDRKELLLEWHPQPGQDKPPAPLLKVCFLNLPLN